MEGLHANQKDEQGARGKKRALAAPLRRCCLAHRTWAQQQQRQRTGDKGQKLYKAGRVSCRKEKEGRGEKRGPVILVIAVISGVRSCGAVAFGLRC